MDAQTSKTRVEPSVEDELMMSLNPPHLRDRGPSEPPPNTNMVGSSLSRGSLPPESNAKTSYKMPDYSDPNVFEAYYKVLTSGAPNPIKGEPGNTNDGSDCAPSNACISAGQAAPNANTPAARASRTYKLRKSLPPKRKGQEWNNVKKDIEKEEKKLGKYRVAIAKKVIWDHGGAAWRKIMVKQEGLNANAPYQNPQKDTRGGGAKLRTLAPTASEDEKKAHAKPIWDSANKDRNFCCDALALLEAEWGCSAKHQLLRTQINHVWYNQAIARARSDGCYQQFKALDPMEVDTESAAFGKTNQTVYKA